MDNLRPYKYIYDILNKEIGRLRVVELLMYSLRLVGVSCYMSGEEVAWGYLKDMLCMKKENDNEIRMYLKIYNPAKSTDKDKHEDAIKEDILNVVFKGNEISKWIRYSYNEVMDYVGTRGNSLFEDDLKQVKIGNSLGYDGRCKDFDINLMTIYLREGKVKSAFGNELDLEDIQGIQRESKTIYNYLLYLNFVNCKPKPKSPIVLRKLTYVGLDIKHHVIVGIRE